MSKRTVAIILEIIPIVSAITSYALIMSQYDSDLVIRIILITFILAFLGFAFFFIGRKLAKGDKIVRILGVFDWIATVYVIAFYSLAIFLFAQ
ncbi:MAG: hypothetical protein IJH91_04365 [Mogibacterium sp.]|nr:hypothetical protein [Mogibacterium sp.]